MTRIVIFTGKGGVGKTTVAAAHAWQSAQMGSQTLLVSTDMAHNLGDLFERRIGREETEIIPGLTALELDPEYIMQQEFGDLLQALGRMMGTREASEEIRIPGMENLFALLKLLALYESGRYEKAAAMNISSWIVHRLEKRWRCSNCQNCSAGIWNAFFRWANWRSGCFRPYPRKFSKWSCRIKTP